METVGKEKGGRSGADYIQGMVGRIHSCFGGKGLENVNLMAKRGGRKLGQSYYASLIFEGGCFPVSGIGTRRGFYMSGPRARRQKAATGKSRVRQLEAHSGYTVVSHTNI